MICSSDYLDSKRAPSRPLSISCKAQQHLMDYPSLHIRYGTHLFPPRLKLSRPCPLSFPDLHNIIIDIPIFEIIIPYWRFLFYRHNKTVSPYVRYLPFAIKCSSFPICVFKSQQSITTYPNHLPTLNKSCSYQQNLSFSSPYLCHKYILELILSPSYILI